MKLIAKYENYRYNIYNDDLLYGAIVYDHNKVSASVFVGEKEFRAVPESDTEKDIVLQFEGKTLFKFKFDYVWGGSEIVQDGEKTGYEITGKFLKPGTRLVDAESNDLVVAESNEQIPAVITITVFENDVLPIMVMATVYYHLYTSASKTLSVLLGSSL